MGTSVHSSLCPCTSVAEIPCYQSWDWGPLTQYGIIWAWWVYNVHVDIENDTVSAEGWTVNESGWGTQYIWSFTVLRGTKFHLVALYDSVNCLFIHRDIGLWELSSLLCLALCQDIAVLIGWARNAPPSLKNLRNTTFIYFLSMFDRNFNSESQLAWAFSLLWVLVTDLISYNRFAEIFYFLRNLNIFLSYLWWLILLVHLTGPK